MSDPESLTTSFARRLPALLIGGGLIVLGALVLIRVNPPFKSATQLCALASCGFGFVWTALALRQRSGRFWDLFRLTNNNALTLTALVVLVEFGGRATGFDFSRLSNKSAQALRQQYPVWSREPDQPVPEVFFKHAGPVVWTGQPLRTLEVLGKGTDNAYANEPSITVSYDADGFRNPVDLKDWQVAVIGDSYTELGYLPIEQVVSSVVADNLKTTVKNVGTCDTGLLSHARFLELYGHATSTHSVVFVMFEGNDVQDTTKEFEALERFKNAGHRDFKSTGPQTSFAAALTTTVRGYKNRPRPHSYQNAWFKRPQAEPLPVTISHELPINPLTATPLQINAVRAGLRAMADQAKRLHLRAVLAYVPVNNRVYHGMLDFNDTLPDEVLHWQPNALPEFIQQACREDGMEFVDTTPALREAATKGHYVHNQILDCHVNAEGSRIIGEVIATALKTNDKVSSLTRAK
jgi:hypothetical protein